MNSELEKHCRKEFSDLLNKDKILDKTQLQRFLGSLNYVLDFCPNINRIAKPLHGRLKKNTVPWTKEHTALVQKLKSSAKDVLQKDVKNLASKKIFAGWQAILSIFNFDIEYIKGDSNSVPDFLTREFFQNR
ncbi:hypothetical protein EUTSA_v10023170mg [Eutrema salsugineum]|uniref:Reverse transcriptase/retrotransposon-derived protein RNase H-like domain-containing protein n=1 Tax=Eutrema salsugineum TaxID=72664 RepID=V4NW62_EUTSA|nr:hypothetical protein EUTSA_v10023170mg [Eutrema salsugineum]